MIDVLCDGGRARADKSLCGAQPDPVPLEFEARVPILLSGAECTGDEARITDCPGSDLTPDLDLSCSHIADASIVCYNDSTEGMDGALRLAGGVVGPDLAYGRLERFRWGLWGNVCDSQAGFSVRSVAVACADLGFDFGIPLPVAEEVLRANLPVTMAAVACTGNETALSACPSDDDQINLCSTRRFVPRNELQFTDGTALACASAVASCPGGGAPAEGDVRLVGGVGTLCDAVHSGVVEVFHQTDFGGLCGSGPVAADVVCRQLGFAHGEELDTHGSADYDYSPDDSPTTPTLAWADVPSCRGLEASILGCAPEFEAARVACERPLQVACRSFSIPDLGEGNTTPGAEEGDVRLSQQTTFRNWVQGRLEVFTAGGWARAACSRTLTPADLSVACRQLGFGSGTVALSGVLDGFLLEADTPDDPAPFEVRLPLGCDGTEARVLDCPGGPPEPGRGNVLARSCDDGLLLACVAEEQAGTEGALRLMGGEVRDDSGFGVLEVFHDGAWGMFCDDLYNNPYYFDPDFTP
eukprot:jgi/Ulvmu1/1300/UM011_0026.1